VVKSGAVDEPAGRSSYPQARCEPRLAHLQDRHVEHDLDFNRLRRHLPALRQSILGRDHPTFRIVLDETGATVGTGATEDEAIAAAAANMGQGAKQHCAQMGITPRAVGPGTWGARVTAAARAWVGSNL